MSKLFNNTTSLNEILEAIQNKTAGSGGIDTSDATATNATILSGYTAYVKGKKITGTIETKTSSNLTASGATVTVPAGYYASAASISVLTATQATPSITISSSGLITASSKQASGFVTGGTKSATRQLITKTATTYTPKTTNQTIAALTYLTGTQTIKGDSNLVASNIKKGVSIFGVSGSLEIASYEEYAGSFSGNAEIVVEGFNVTFKIHHSTTGHAFYSLDNGVTWIDIIDLTVTSGSGEEVTISGVSQIKFKTIYKDGLYGWIRSLTDGVIDYYIDFGGEIPELISENYILTKDLFLSVRVEVD